jgi:lipoyl synthase
MPSISKFKNPTSTRVAYYQPSPISHPENLSPKYINHNSASLRDLCAFAPAPIKSGVKKIPNQQSHIPNLHLALSSHSPTFPHMSTCGPKMKMDPTLHRERKPDWIKVRLPNNPAFWSTKSLITDLKLVTVCEEAQCPNRWECWGQGTATFMIAGDKCTRACGFCAVKTAKPDALESDEPHRVAQAAQRMNLKHIVITAVARDDLQDGGALHFQETILAVRQLNPGIIIEVLVPDFNDRDWALQLVMDARPHIFNHNLETVERLTPLVRSRAKYQRSLIVLKKAKAMVNNNVATKSGIMLGLGEHHDEILRAMDDLLAHDVTVLTLGQYLRPSPKHLPVVEYIHPEKFEEYKSIALQKGFRHCASGPLVRSSYHAADFKPELDVLEAIEADLRSLSGLELGPEHLPLLQTIRP